MKLVIEMLMIVDHADVLFVLKVMVMVDQTCNMQTRHRQKAMMDYQWCGWPCNKLV